MHDGFALGSLTGDGLEVSRSAGGRQVLDIEHCGNNLGVRVPAAIARAAHLHADQCVSITVEGERVIITPIRDERLTLEQRLACFDPECRGGEAMSAEEALGAELRVKAAKAWAPKRQDVIWIAK